MELHYLTLKRQADYLSTHLLEGVIEDSYSQKKNEQMVVIKSATGKMLELILSADPLLPFIILRPAQKRARLSTNVMPDLIGKTITQITISDMDRILSFAFAATDEILKCQFFRHRTNFFLVDRNNRIKNVFKHQKKYLNTTFQIAESKKIDPLKISSEELFNTFEVFSALPFNQFLKKNVLYITPLVLQEMSIRTQLNIDVFIEDVNRSKLDLFLSELQGFIQHCSADPPRVYLDNNHPVCFALSELQTYRNYSCQIFETINDALIFYIFNRLKSERQQKQLERIQTLIDKKLRQLEEFIGQLSQLPDEQSERKNLQKMGELLLAHLNMIPARAESVEIPDLFDLQQKPIRISLDSTLSPQENAERYFQKAREVSEKIRKRKEKLKFLQQQKTQIVHMKEAIVQQPDMKNLQRIEQKLLELHFMQTDEEKMREIYRPYRQYLYENWEIWVGKNARDNDQMTFKFAHKEDFWLHAQGVGGSHVIIRKASHQEDPPRSVLEYAARLAATHSQARHSTYVPVMYTRVKYVRKPRGSDPGVVLPERVKSIFVEPLSNE